MIDFATHTQLSEVLRSTHESSYYEVSKICEGLFKSTPISHFQYFRFYDSGQLINFGTTPDLSAKAYYEQCIPSFEQMQCMHRIGLRYTFVSHRFILPDTLDNDFSRKYEQFIADAAKSSVYNGLYILDRKDNYFRTCGFHISKDERTIFNYYLNNLLYLENFIRHFDSYVPQLYQKYIGSNLITIPHYNLLSSKNERLGKEITSDIELTEFTAKHVLTPREIECLELISHGYTMKTAARKLGISPRTVEQHIRNIKDKHGFNNKNQLVEIWHEQYKGLKQNTSCIEL